MTNTDYVLIVFLFSIMTLVFAKVALMLDSQFAYGFVNFVGGALCGMFLYKIFRE